MGRGPRVKENVPQRAPPTGEEGSGAINAQPGPWVRLVSRSGAHATSRSVPTLASLKSPWHILIVSFVILGEIAAVECIASGREIRDLRRLQRLYGKEGWRKM